METIAALSTAPVKGAIGVIRISGDDAREIAEKVFKSRRSFEHHPREMLYGDFYTSENVLIDRGMAVFFKGPNSYTGEDTVEFNCHGAVAVIGEILNSLYIAGARPAKPGEYTRRAFLNGRMDLTQAEAVIDLIDAETVAAAKNAVAQIEGVFGAEIKGAYQPLLDIASAFYAYVDYPDDEIEQDEIDATVKVLDDMQIKLSAIAESYNKGKILKDGISCAIVGRPNVGKSSLLNALLGYERSIVTDIAGTTRDTVEELYDLSGVRLRFIDTAGMRDTLDKVEAFGVERARAAVEKADIVIAVFDSAQEFTKADEEVISYLPDKKRIAVINKTDLENKLDEEKICSEFGERVVRISAKENKGIEKLTQMLKDIFAIESIPCTGQTVTNPRHAQALRKAAEHIKNAKDALAGGLTPDVAVSDIESALGALEELTGKTASDEVLARIFERFCVGK